MTHRVRNEHLSRQEQRVIEQVAEGRTNKEIGEILHLSFRTVKNYLSNAFQKLHVKRRIQAVQAAATLSNATIRADGRSR